MPQSPPKSEVALCAIRVSVELCSESRDQSALVLPVARQSVPHAPVGREAKGLFAIEDIADYVRSEEGQINQLMDPAVRGALGLCDLRQRAACFDLLKPEMRPGDVADEGLVDTCRCIGEDDLRLDATLPQPEREGREERIFCDPATVCANGFGHCVGIQLQVQPAGRYVDAGDQTEERIRFTSRSNCAKLSNMFSVSRPMLVAVLNDWVTDTKDASAASRMSTIFEKSASDRVSRSIL